MVTRYNSVVFENCKWYATNTLKRSLKQYEQGKGTDVSGTVTKSIRKLRPPSLAHVYFFTI